MLHRLIERRWRGGLVVVAAPGPSLTPEVGERCRPYRTVAVNDAWQLVPHADVLYGCDERWWDHHEGVPEFAGEKWSSQGHADSAVTGVVDDKLECADRWGLNLVRARNGDGFSLDARWIHYGDNSGFQAINLAILMGATTIALVGFNMQRVRGRWHFFGDHPEGWSQGDLKSWCYRFDKAAELLPEWIRVYNCTAESALTCFPQRTPDDFQNLARESFAKRLPDHA